MHTSLAGRIVSVLGKMLSITSLQLWRCMAQCWVLNHELVTSISRLSCLLYSWAIHLISHYSSSPSCGNELWHYKCQAVSVFPLVSISGMEKGGWWYTWVVHLLETISCWYSFDKSASLNSSILLGLNNEYHLIATVNVCILKLYTLIAFSKPFHTFLIDGHVGEYIWS